MSLSLLVITACISYVTSTMILEVISISNAMETKERRGTLFPNECYSSFEKMERTNRKDKEVKKSPYYIRQKIELGMMAEKHAGHAVKYAFMTILTIYMYGAMCLKYVSGASSFVEAISFTVYGDRCTWKRNWPSFDPYYLGIIVFGTLSITFSFGNIENAKMLQIITSVMRLTAILLMYIGTFIYLGRNGVNAGPVFDFEN